MRVMKMILYIKKGQEIDIKIMKIITIYEIIF